MDPQQNNNPRDQFEETPLPADLVEQPTQSFQPVADKPKASHKRAVVMAIIGLVVVLAAVGAYIVYFQMNDKTADNTKTTQQTPAPKTASPVDDAAGVMTDGATAEDKLTDTDDSSDVDDASQAAGNVGDSVNENNF